MIDVKNNFLLSLSKIVNRCIHLDPKSKQRLQALQGKSISITFLPFHQTILLSFDVLGITIMPAGTVLPDAKVSGTPLQMIELFVNKNRRHALYTEELVIEGNVEFAQQAMELFDGLSIDWEDHLSRIVGDVPAYHGRQLARRVDRWFQQLGGSIVRSTKEFFHEESGWFPAKEAIEDFCHDVDTLRMDVDRILARMNLLHNSLIDEEHQ